MASTALRMNLENIALCLAQILTLQNCLSWMKQSEQAKPPHSVSDSFVCLSVFCNIMNNFWMDGPKWMKFLWLSRLVAANLRACSTSAQSPQVRAGPAYSPFPCSLSPPWSLVLLVHVKPFWKAFNKVNHNVIADFLFWNYTCTGRLCGFGLWGRS